MLIERGTLVICRGIACVVILTCGNQAIMSPMGRDDGDFTVENVSQERIQVIAGSPAINRTQEEQWRARESDWLKMIAEKERLAR